MGTRGRWRRGWARGALTIALAVALTAGLLTPPADASLPPFPTFSGTEFKAFYYASLPLPGTQRITARPSIYGHAGADSRIQQLAEARGYRLQATPTVPLGSYSGVTLVADAGRAWQRLAEAARRNGTPLQGNSGYRSVATQREIFKRRLGSYSTSQIASGAADRAIETVLAYHSIPGYSRHHTGKTLDLSHAGGSNGSFASTAAYRWISTDNYRVAKAHGFIPSYPPGAGAQGPNPEPWEFVYVGADRIRCAIRVVALADVNAAPICGIPDVPVVGELTADGLDDVLVYRPGRRPEGLFPGTRSRAQASLPATAVNGFYAPLVGDFRGDGTDDILWYAPGTAADYLWVHAPDGSRRVQAITVNGAYLPVVGDFRGDGIDDILWYAPGPAPDFLWTFRADGTFSSRPANANGGYFPVAGDFNGDGIDDILWYAPGTAADFLWMFRADGTYSGRPVEINGSYRPRAGDFNGDGVDDVLWYASGTAPDFVWYHRPGGARASRPVTINGTYTIGTGDHDGDGFDDVVFVAPEGKPDAIWFGATSGFAPAPRTY